MACVNIPDFPLQLLLHRNPAWRSQAVAVVDNDTARGRILLTNHLGRRRGIAPGMRLFTALDLAVDLRAAAVSEMELTNTHKSLIALLQTFSPEVESSTDESAIFWVNPAGLGRLYASLKSWVGAIHCAIHNLGFRAAIAVGFSRFGSYALAKSSSGIQIMRDASQERSCLGHVPIVQLQLSHAAVETLHKLGVVSLHDLMRLPRHSIPRCLGTEIHELLNQLQDDSPFPLRPDPLPVEFVEKEAFASPVTQLPWLKPVVERLLERIVRRLASHRFTLTQAVLILSLDNRDSRSIDVLPAAPMNDRTALLRLIMLRLEMVVMEAGVTELELKALGARTAAEQLQLSLDHPPRDLDAAREAITQIRAEFGEPAARKLQLADSHLPESQYRWLEIDTLTVPNPRPIDGLPLIRNIHSTPIPLMVAEDLRHGNIPGEGQGRSSSRLCGPYRIESGWWDREIRRDYYFLESRSGEMAWVFQDLLNGAWRQQGEVV